MGHRLAVVVAALVFSLTIGVLVGVVVHAGKQQRANDQNRPTTAVSTSSETSSDDRR